MIFDRSDRRDRPPRLTLVTPPAVEPISLTEAKEHCRVEGSDSDQFLARAILTARLRLEALTGRALITQTWKLTLDRFLRAIEIPLPPCQAVTAIDYFDSNGRAQTVDLQTISIEGVGDAAPAIVRPLPQTSWPATIDLPAAVSITFRSGYGDTADDVPEQLRTAILMHVAQQYDNRWITMAPGSGTMATPEGYDDLVSDFRLRGFG
jgi:uncharacterized phiE125 gp8 family phage protein